MGSAARVTSSAEGLPRRRFTVAEVEAMVAAGVMEEDERVELIGGEVPMSPKGNHHEVLKIALLAIGFALRQTTANSRRKPRSGSARTPTSSLMLSFFPARSSSRISKVPTCSSSSRSPILRAAMTWAARRTLCQLRSPRTLGDRRGPTDYASFSRAGRRRLWGGARFHGDRANTPPVCA